MNSHIGKNIFESKVSSTAKQTITVPQFLSIEALLPSLLEQRKIAEILYQIDETIEKEQKYKQKLESIKQGLMEDLLTGKVRVNHLIKQGEKNVQPA
jgi:type I restriction enzyme S subunit